MLKMSIKMYIFTSWMCECTQVKKGVWFAAVCAGSAAYLGASILMKAGCEDAEWQPKRCESWGQQRSRAGMTVAEMKGSSWGRETRYRSSAIAWCAVWFSVSASWKISPAKQRGYWERERGECCAQWGVHGKGNCVCFSVSGGWQRYSPQQRDQGAYERKQKCLASEWLRWREERLSNPRLGAQKCLAKSAILNSHLGFGR